MKRMVLVEWNDCQGQGSWHTLAEARKSKPAICISVGFLLKKNYGHILIVGTKDNLGGVSDRNTIPIKCVRRITELVEHKK